jgi:hypothetical protein
MKKTLIIEIPEPCNEKWSEMEPTANGRACARCERELIDFTTFSDRQLADYVSKHNGKLCGHFSSRQLNNNLLPVSPIAIGAASYTGLSLPALAPLAVTLTANPVQAQVTPPPTETVSQKNPIKSPPEEHIVNGMVTDVETGEPVTGAHVILQLNGVMVMGMATDIDGYFTFRVQPGTTYDTLLVRMTGMYEETRVALDPDLTIRGMRIRMQPFPVEIEGMVILREDSDAEPAKVKKHRRRNR